MGTGKSNASASRSFSSPTEISSPMSGPSIAVPISAIAAPRAAVQTAGSSTGST